MDEEGLENVRENFFEEVEEHFEYMWYHLEENEQTCLAAIAESRDLDRKLNFLARKLARRGFLIKDDGTYKIFSECFRNLMLSDIMQRIIMVLHYAVDK